MLHGLDTPPRLHVPLTTCSGICKELNTRREKEACNGNKTEVACNVIAVRSDLNMTMIQISVIRK